MGILSVALLERAHCVTDKCSANNCLLFIVFCDPAITCNGKGICTIDGTCNCEAMFYGESCLSKLRKNCDIFLVHHKTNIFYFKLFHSCLSLSLYM